MALMSLSNHRIQEIEIDLFLMALKERWGYDFTGYARASLKRRMEQLLDAFKVDCLSRLMPSLLYDQDVAQAAINAISVPTSEFFRDPAVWLYIRDEMSAYLHSFPHLNIWQVGCGHGQETYTLAILLHEVGLLKKTRIVTTDINNAYLETARQGCWPKRHLDEWRSNYQQAGGTRCFDDYFEIEQSSIKIHEAFKDNIEFVQHNLAFDDAFLETQFIVCRNVLIYFGENLQKRVFGIFERSLERGGYLLLGCTENLLETNVYLEACQLNLRLFRKTIWGANG